MNTIQPLNIFQICEKHEKGTTKNTPLSQHYMVRVKATRYYTMDEAASVTCRS